MARIIKLSIYLVLNISLFANPDIKFRTMSKGLYIKLLPEEFDDKREKFINFEYMFNNTARKIFFFDGEKFRSSGGPLTARPEKDIIHPYLELYGCNINKEYICYNKSYYESDMYYVPLELNNGILKYEWHEVDGRTGTGYFVRVNDFYLARKFITAVDALMMYKNKNLSDFGYIRPEIKFAVANQYKPYVTALILREAPGKKGKKLDTLFSGDILTVTEITKKIDTIDKIKAPWVKIKTSTGKEGYVFGGFLEPLGE